MRLACQLYNFGKNLSYFIILTRFNNKILTSHRKITMTHTQTTYTNRIALRAGKKGARPAEVGALATVFEKSPTELKQQKLQNANKQYK